jgi:hypothetical protein
MALLLWRPLAEMKKAAETAHRRYFWNNATALSASLLFMYTHVCLALLPWRRPFCILALR